MKVHLFVATSSPSCAAFSLRQAALDFGHGYKPLVASTVEGAAHVDDVLASVSDVEADLPKAVQAHSINSNLHERILRVTLHRCRWRQRTRVLHRCRSRVRLHARNRVRMPTRNRVRMRARSCLWMHARNRVLMRAKNRVRLRARNHARMPTRNRLRMCSRSGVRMNERSCLRVLAWRRDRVWLIYDVGALAPKIVTQCGASPSVFVIMPSFRLCRWNATLLKQVLYKMHCWFTQPDANLLLTCEHFLLPARKLVSLIRLFVYALFSSFLLWWFNWFCLKNLVL